MKKTSEFWIESLGLLKHPEGGYFKEVYRSNEIIPTKALPERFGGDRSFSTSIYFLLKNSDISAFHRINQDETWHFYYGDSVNIYIIDSCGFMDVVKLGNNPVKNEVLQYTVTKNCWFSASILPLKAKSKFDFCLVGCTVAPGFDFADFEMAKRADLLKQYPEFSEIIKKHTI